MLFIAALTILFLDQLSKIIISHRLSLGESVPLIKNIFHLTLVYNYGAAFGIFKGGFYLFIITALVAIILIYRDLKKSNYHKFSLQGIAFSFILAGACGNLIDRLRFGYVIDFLDFRVWPVFNIADSAITVGAVLLGYSILKSKVQSEKRKT